MRYLENDIAGKLFDELEAFVMYKFKKKKEKDNLKHGKPLGKSRLIVFHQSALIYSCVFIGS